MNDETYNGNREAFETMRETRLVRDPKTDPRPGDIFKDRHGHIIVIRQLGRGETRDPELWRKAMRGAEVLHVAES